MPSSVRVLAVAAVAIVFGTGARAGEDGLKPGDVLGKDNWQRAESLLPPEILKHYREGEYVNPVVSWDTYNWPPDLRAASQANEGRFAIGEHGDIIDKATGKQPPSIFGHPFPTIDAGDPQGGAKAVWNFFYRSWYFGNIHAESQLNWIGERRLERRTDQDVRFLYYDGVAEAERPKNSQNFLYQQLVVVTGPADLHGTAALTWRYRDAEKRDSAWSFVPALRRVRAVSPANRSDGFLGSDFSQDDGVFFDGKVEDFVWTLHGQTDQLRLADPLNLQGKHQSEWLPRGGWRTIWPDLKFLGYMDPDWRGVGWAPSGGVLAKRRFWIVEGVPKDKYYLYGKLQLLIDTESYQGSWNRKFSWKGELLNTMQAMAYNPLPDTRPDGKVDWNQGSSMAYQCAESVRANRATAVGIKSSPTSGFDLRVTFDPADFDVDALSRHGK